MTINTNANNAQQHNTAMRKILFLLSILLPLLVLAHVADGYRPAIAQMFTDDTMTASADSTYVADENTTDGNTASAPKKAKITYTEDTNLPTVSTDTDEFWYTIQTNNGKQYVTAKGNGANTKDATSISEESFWKFELREDGTYNIINKDGLYLQPSGITSNLKTSRKEPSAGWTITASEDDDDVFLSYGTSTKFFNDILNKLLSNIGYDLSTTKNILKVAVQPVTIDANSLYTIRLADSDPATFATTVLGKSGSNDCFTVRDNAEEFLLEGDANNGWKIKSYETGKYVGYNTQTLNWLTNNIQSLWTIEQGNDGLWTIRRKGGSVGLGTDNTPSGSPYFSDKPSANASGHYKWVITKSATKVTLRYMVDTTQYLSVQTGYVPLGTSVRDVATTYLPNGYVLDEQEFGIVADGASLTYDIAISAYDTPNNWGNSTNNDGRYTSSISISSPTLGTSTITGLQTAGKQAIYWDKTTSNHLKCVAGEMITPSVGYQGAWLHAYFWLDQNHDGFACTADNTSHTISGDLYAWTFYSFDQDPATGGWNDQGNYLTGSARNTWAMAACQAPTTPGLYRVRFIVCWNNINPMGFEGIKTNGGIIVDALLEVQPASSETKFPVTLNNLQTGWYNIRNVVGNMTTAAQGRYLRATELGHPHNYTDPNQITLSYDVQTISSLPATTDYSTYFYVTRTADNVSVMLPDGLYVGRSCSRTDGSTNTIALTAPDTDKSRICLQNAASHGGNYWDMFTNNNLELLGASTNSPNARFAFYEADIANKDIYTVVFSNTINASTTLVYNKPTYNGLKEFIDGGVVFMPKGVIPLASDFSGNGQEVSVEVRTTDKTIRVSTVSYATNFDGQNSTCQSRYTAAIKLTGAKSGEQTVTGLQTGVQQALVWNKTTETFVVKAGEVLTPAVVPGNHNWNNAYCYIDFDNDGFRAGIAANHYTPTHDLVSYSFYNDGESTPNRGYNSAGTVLEGSARNTVVMPSFTAPTTPGTYRMRYKVDWCSIDPKGQNVKDDVHGNSTLQECGGIIVDVMLQVVAEQDIPFTQHDGSWTKTNAAGTYASEWQSDTSRYPLVTIACSQNNMQWDTNGDPKCFTGSNNYSHTYTITAPTGYEIESVRFNFQRIGTEASSVSLDGDAAVATPASGTAYKEKTGINKSSTTLVINTTNINKGVLFTNFFICLRSHVDYSLPNYGNTSFPGTGGNARYTTYVSLKSILDEQRGRRAQIKDNLQTHPDYAGAVRTVVWDRTGDAQPFECVAGETIYPQLDYHGFAMHGYFYLDEGNNGFDQSVVDEANHIIAGDIQAWSRYSYSTDAGRTGYDNYDRERNLNNCSTAPCVAPTKPGLYRARYIMAYNNVNPTGYAAIASDGGIIVDVMIRVVAPTKSDINVLYNRITQHKGELGYYTVASVDAHAAEVAAAKAVYDNSAATQEEISAAFMQLAAAARAMQLEAPKTGHFYRFRGKNSSQYMIGSTKDWTHNVAGVMVTDPAPEMKSLTDAARPTDIASVYYYSDSTNIISFDKGRFIGAGCILRDILQFDYHNDPTQLGEYEFFANDEHGMPYMNIHDLVDYGILFGHLVYDHGAANGRIDRNSSSHINTGWMVEEVFDLPVKMSVEGYTTLFTPVRLSVPDNVRAYYACVNEDKPGFVRLSRVNEIEPGTAVVLKGTPNALYTLDIIYDTQTAVIEDGAGAPIGDYNALQGRIASTTKPTFPVLTLGHEKTSNHYGFFTYTGTTMKGFRSWMEDDGCDAEFPEEAAAVRGYQLSLDDITSAIDAADNDSLRDDVTYNINGQRITKKQGLVIVNGKKFIVD